MHDLVIRNAKIVDGTGAPAFAGDVGVDGERISAVGSTVDAGKREIDAAGRLLAPGWVDIHTHYDGQVTWDPELTPSCWHGVTTVVMGNCGVGFAPVKPDRHAWLIGLMEGVEDIPGTALSEGIRWEWETFPEYLDALDRGRRVLDVGTQVPHGAVRAYVMGERGAKNEVATAEDIAAMAHIVGEAVAAGALGFSTSRTMLHRAIDGEPVPGTFAAAEEVLGIGAALGRLRAGVFEMASDLMPEDREFAWMKEFALQTGRPLTFALLQSDFDPSQWRRLLTLTEEAVAEGARITAQIAVRPTGLLLGWDSNVHPFLFHSVYKEVAALPLAERLVRLREPGFRDRLLAESPQFTNPFAGYVATAFHKMFPLGDPPNYEPAPDASVAAIAAREGRTPQAVVYDMMLQRDGRELLYLPILNYADGNFEPIHEMLLHPNTVISLSDGGAHCGVICDAGSPTYLLTHWVRDRSRGPRLPLEFAVRRQTAETAALYGLHDRGMIRPGLLADLNVIDFDRLGVELPALHFDLPANGKRLLQRARGYDYTIKSGQVTFESGNATGARPGALVRGARNA